jgi:hypothetical protein
MISINQLKENYHRKTWNIYFKLLIVIELQLKSKLILTYRKAARDNLYF